MNLDATDRTLRPFLQDLHFILRDKGIFFGTMRYVQLVASSHGSDCTRRPLRAFAV
jgi:hypothetical protein